MRLHLAHPASCVLVLTRMGVALLIVLVGCASLPDLVQAQTAEDELGNWWIYNGTLHFSERWSMFTEAQVRLYETHTNVNDVFGRVAGHYELSDNSLVGLGYMYSTVWPFDDTNGGTTEHTENRIYQQFTTHQPVLGTRFEHRYRLEERWLKQTVSGETDFSLRVRYRLQVTVPLNRDAMGAGVWFLNFYDEIFVTFDDPRVFDQNRLYGAAGYQFTSLSNLQLGFLWQAREREDFYRLQIFYTHNFDFMN